MRLFNRSVRSNSVVGRHWQRTLLATVLWLVPFALFAQTLTIVSGNNQIIIPNQPSQALVVQATDSRGALVGATVLWSSANATASFDNASTTTDSKGQSSNRLKAILPGSYTVTAQLAGTNAPVSVNFVIANAVANVGGLTGPQASVAHAIDLACPALATSSTPISAKQGDFLKRCSEVVVGAGAAAIPNVLDQMLNNKSQPQSQLASNVQTSQSDNLNARMAELRSGVQGVSVGGLGVVSDGKVLPLAMLGDTFRKEVGDSNSNQAGKDFSRWGFFATGFISHGGFSANEARPGFDFDSASITAGVDYRFSDALVGGVAVGYNHDSADFNLDAGNVDVDGLSEIAYFTWYHNDSFYVTGSATLSQLDFDITRNIIYQIAAVDGSGGVTSVNQAAKASPNGNQTSVSLTLGRDFNNGALAFSPYLRGTYSHVKLDGFSEEIDSTGPGFGLGTAVEGRTRNGELGVIGARMSYTTSHDWGVLVPNAVVEWNHDFKNDPQTTITRFLSDPTSTPVIVTSPALDADYFNLGLGLNAIFPQGKSGFLYYEHVAGLTGAHLNRFSVGVRVEF